MHDNLERFIFALLEYFCFFLILVGYIKDLLFEIVCIEELTCRIFVKFVYKMESQESNANTSHISTPNTSEDESPNTSHWLKRKFYYIPDDDDDVNIELSENYKKLAEFRKQILDLQSELEETKEKLTQNETKMSEFSKEIQALKDEMEKKKEQNEAMHIEYIKDVQDLQDECNCLNNSLTDYEKIKENTQVKLILAQAKLDEELQSDEI